MYTYVKNCQNRERFDKDVAKNKTVQFFASHGHIHKVRLYGVTHNNYIQTNKQSSTGHERVDQPLGARNSTQSGAPCHSIGGSFLSVIVPLQLDHEVQYINITKMLRYFRLPRRNRPQNSVPARITNSEDPTSYILLPGCRCVS